jgi:capsular polysaccharide export protein
VKFIDQTSNVPAGGVLAIWGMREKPGDMPGDLRVLRLEDGFLRSVGLGADLIRPVSWVVDSRGMYYDATRPSDLEWQLASTAFDLTLRRRATLLRERIVAEGLTKYNVGVARWRRPLSATKVILVPGQVESDASLAYGAPGLRSNIGLLKAVREANPGAHLVYKPHPDVIAGLRAKGVAEDEAGRFSDELLTDAPMGELLMAVDEVHVLTSLAGFEALLRKRPVTCYGQPFYAGWGLTTDILPNPRRVRRLSLDELVAGALITYPRYLSRTRRRLITPEQALDELLAWRAKAGGVVPWWRHCVRRVLRRVVGVR